MCTTFKTHSLYRSFELETLSSSSCFQDMHEILRLINDIPVNCLVTTLVSIKEYIKETLQFDMMHTLKMTISQVFVNFPI